MVHFLKDYWWIIIVILICLFINAMKDLSKVSFESYLKKRRKPKEIENKKNEGK